MSHSVFARAHPSFRLLAVTAGTSPNTFVRASTPRFVCCCDLRLPIHLEGTVHLLQSVLTHNLCSHIENSLSQTHTKQKKQTNGSFITVPLHYQIDTYD